MLELGFELFARVFVVDACREPNEIKGQSAIGIGQRVIVRFGFLVVDFEKSYADNLLTRGLCGEINGDTVIVPDMTRSGHQDCTVGVVRRDQALRHLSVSGPLYTNHQFHAFLGSVAAMRVAYISRDPSEHRLGRWPVETQVAYYPRLESRQAITAHLPRSGEWQIGRDDSDRKSVV